jgi:peptide/nickel transport system permease protein/oligopeptide transport system permease protein
MRRYVVRRLLTAIPLLLAVSALTFLLLRVIPGDPAFAMAGERYDAETIARLRRELGLDETRLAQFARFLGGLARGDLGVSFSYQRPVTELILERFPHTLLLAAAATFLAVASGVFLGGVAARRPGSIVDRAVTVACLFGVSVPVFTTGLLLALLFGVLWRAFPPSGSEGWDLRYLVLPAITLSTQSVALIARVTRASLLEVAARDYVRTARAKGVGERRVFFHHLLANAAIPIVTVVGADFGSYLGGSILTESVFGWPGVGRLTLAAITRRDFPLIQGIVLFMAALFIAVNLAVDCLYAALNPRVSAESS